MDGVVGAHTPIPPIDPIPYRMVMTNAIDSPRDPVGLLIRMSVAVSATVPKVNRNAMSGLLSSVNPKWTRSPQDARPEPQNANPIPKPSVRRTFEATLRCSPSYWSRNVFGLGSDHS